MGLRKFLCRARQSSRLARPSFEPLPPSSNQSDLGKSAYFYGESDQLAPDAHNEENRRFTDMPLHHPDEWMRHIDAMVRQFTDIPLQPPTKRPRSPPLKFSSPPHLDEYALSSIAYALVQQEQTTHNAVSIEDPDFKYENEDEQFLADELSLASVHEHERQKQLSALDSEYMQRTRRQCEETRVHSNRCLQTANTTDGLQSSGVSYTVRLDVECTVASNVDSMAERRNCALCRNTFCAAQLVLRRCCGQSWCSQCLRVAAQGAIYCRSSRPVRCCVVTMPTVVFAPILNEPDLRLLRSVLWAEASTLHASGIASFGLTHPYD